MDGKDCKKKRDKVTQATHMDDQPDIPQALVLDFVKTAALLLFPCCISVRQAHKVAGRDHEKQNVAVRL